MELHAESLGVDAGNSAICSACQILSCQILERYRFTKLKHRLRDSCSQWQGCFDILHRNVRKSRVISVRTLPSSSRYQTFVSLGGEKTISSLMVLMSSSRRTLMRLGLVSLVLMVIWELFLKHQSVVRIRT